MSAHHLVILIPAYNEAGRIEAAIREIRAACAGLDPRIGRTDIFVIDDGSHDDTRRLAEQAGADRIVRHRVNRGLGAAVRSGLQAAHAAGATLALKIDADLQHDPAQIGAMLAPLLDDEADLVYGDRTEGYTYRPPFIRRAGNMVFTGLMRRLTGWPLRDSQPGIFAVNAAYLDIFQLPGNYNYTQQILLDAYHKGMRFAHVPVRFRARTTGRSFVSLRYPFKVLPQILMVLVGVRPLLVFGSIGFTFISMALLATMIDLSHWMLVGAARPVMHVNFVLGTGLFGVQTLFFGLLAQLIIQMRR